MTSSVWPSIFTVIHPLLDVRKRGEVLDLNCSVGKGERNFPFSQNGGTIGFGGVRGGQIEMGSEDVIEASLSLTYGVVYSTTERYKSSWTFPQRFLKCVLRRALLLEEGAMQLLT